jgi:hypothetical protein
MKKLPTVLLLALWMCLSVRAQDELDSIAGVFYLDSITVEAIHYGLLNPKDFIKRTMNDTSLFHAFSMMKVLPFKMEMESTLFDKKGRQTAYKKEWIEQHMVGNCRWQDKHVQDSTGAFFDKKGNYLSETLRMIDQLFKTDRRLCNQKVSKSPEGLVVLNKPKDIRQQREMIKRIVFAPHTLRVEVPFFGNKMKTNIFEKPTADMYQFRVTTGMFEGWDPTYEFEVTVDSVKYPDWEKNVLIKSMRTSFRKLDMAIVERNYELFYPGLMAGCNISLRVKMQNIDNYLVPEIIRYSGRWKFPTKGTDMADVNIRIFEVTTHECFH